MRANTTPELLEALRARSDSLRTQGIHTAFLVRLDFRSETVFIWTGGFDLTVTGTGDTLCDGQTFQAFQSSVLIDIGENTFTTSGSEALEMSMAIPVSAPDYVTESMIHPLEYHARPATVWRAVMVDEAGLAGPARWVIRRIRVGTMDTIEVSHGSTSSTYKLTIESYAGSASSSSQSSYFDQKRFDPADTSQEFASSAVNGSPGNVTNVASISYGGSGGGFTGGSNLSLE